MDRELAERIDAIIDGNWNDQLAFLAGLVTRPSTLGDEAHAQRFLAAELERIGLRPDLWEVDPGAIARLPGFSAPEWGYAGRPNVTATWRSTSSAGRSLILNGHIDVVPVEPEHAWSFEPFGAGVVDGRMYGRGAADMKSGVAAMIYAVRALREAGVALAGDVMLQSVIEEECTGNGALATLARGMQADAVIIPEPFGQTALVAQVGVMWARIMVHGAGAHVLGAEKAANAFLKARPLVDAILELERIVNDEPKHAAFADHPHPLNFNIGVIGAGDWPSSVPSECILEVRISAYPGADLDEVRSRFRDHVLQAAEGDPWLADHPPDVVFFGFRAEGCVMDADGPLFDVLEQAHRRVEDAPLERLASTATTDARFYTLYQGVPATCYGPLGGNLHAPDEWVDLASVRATTRVLASTIVDWCGLA